MKDVIILKENERIDDLHRNGYMLIQNPNGFCFGVDAVLLSGFAKGKKNGKILDLCTGTGVVPILMHGKYGKASYVGIDIQKDSIDMAKRSVTMNGLEQDIKMYVCDVKELSQNFEKASFDAVTVNPPYIETRGGLKNNTDAMAIARHEVLLNLDDIIKGSKDMLKFGGRLYMIHRPHRLSDIIYKLRENNIEPKKLRFIHSYINKEPSMVLIEGVRGGKPMLKVLPPIVIYDDKGGYTQEVKDIYYN